MGRGQALWGLLLPMTPWSFVIGALASACIVMPAAVSARCVRRRWFAGTGPTVLLVEAVVALAQIYAVASILGAVGWFRRWPVAGGEMMVGLGLAFASRRAGPKEPSSPTRPQQPTRRTATYLAGLATIVVLGQYLARTIDSLQRGMYDSDTLWYHGPVAARFVQDGWTTRLYFEGGQRVVTYYQANGELAGALVMLPFHRDALLPVLNLAWLALALLAGWCIGRSHGRGPVGVTAVAAILSLPIVAFRQAGTLGNDLPATALLLASVALALEADWRAPWLVLSGVGAGLAFGVKLSAIPPVLVLGAALAVVAPARLRRASVGAWCAGFAGPAIYWPIRDWVRMGNPFPWWSVNLGPIHLSGVPLTDPSLHHTSVLDYLGRPSVWTGVFAPGLRLAFGPGWPVIIALAALGGTSVLVAGRSRIDRAMAAVGVLGIGFYTTIPSSVVLPPQMATLTFADTVRYAVPALAVALVALGASRHLERLVPATAMTFVLAGLVVLAQVPRDALPGTYPVPLPATDVVLGFVISGGIAAAAFALTRLGRAHIRMGLIAVAGLAVVWPLERSTLEQYANTSGPGSGTGSVFHWGRNTAGARIAVAGAWAQLPFYGPDLSNHVQYIRITGPNSTFHEATTCSSWRRAVDAGHYDYLVMFPPPPFVAVGPGALRHTWLSADQNAVLIARYRDGEVWKLRGPLDPSTCRKL